MGYSSEAVFMFEPIVPIEGRSDDRIQEVISDHGEKLGRKGDEGRWTIGTCPTDIEEGIEFVSSHVAPKPLKM